MHLLLMIPSVLLLALLFTHSWKYRGRAVTISFFSLSFIFGIIRGNTIYWIITGFLGGDSLPYLFVRPMVHLWNASFQECVGWTFTLYLCWTVAERILARQDKGGLSESANLRYAPVETRPYNRTIAEKIPARQGGDPGAAVPVYRLLGLACLLMGTVSYAVEAVAAGVQWWVWVIPIKNPHFADVPFVGIVAWISVGVDFLVPFMLITRPEVRKKVLWLLVFLFPAHMLTHLKVTSIAPWLPMSPNELWHWLFLCAIFTGIVLGGPGIQVASPVKESGKKSFLRYAVWAVAAGFLLVLGAAHLAVIRRPEVLISLLPFVTGLLFVRPKYAIPVSLAACLAYALAVPDGWTFTLAPLAVVLIFAYSALVPALDHRTGAGRLRMLKISLVAFLCLSTAAVYFAYHNRNVHYNQLGELGKKLAERSFEVDELILERMCPRPLKSGDAFHYNQMGKRLLLRRQFKPAIFLLEKGLACDSTFAYLQMHLAWAYSQTGRLEDAMALYEKSLKLNPIDYGTYLNLGKLYEDAGKKGEAESLYRRALEYGPNNTRIVLALERILYKDGRHEEAIALLREVLTGTADSIEIMSNLATNLLKAGHDEQAEARYKQVIRKDIQHLYASCLSLSMLYFNREDYSKALEYADLAARVNPTRNAHRLRGMLYNKMGRPAEARAAFREAADVN
ncbi:MAG: tetratricopeptide repeat protein [Gemmatimonadota bacterium]|nr:tetratricopeptide repeat protein [Gemmatimonadota bacterium]